MQTTEQDGLWSIDGNCPSQEAVQGEDVRDRPFRLFDLDAGKPFFTNAPADLPETFRLENGEKYPDRILCVPVVLKDELMGRIALADSPRIYGQRDLDAVQRLSDMYALALQRHWREMEQEKMAAQLRQANKMEAVGTLAGGLAHDFNNLLMGIQGNTSLMLLELETNHPHYEQLKHIEQYVQSGSNLTKQLLGFARGGKYEVRTSNLNELVAKSLEMFARAKKEIDILHEYEEGLWPVDVDPGQIEQVFINIYVNAWQAMPSGGAVYVRTENAALTEQYTDLFDLKPGRYVKVSITDTGPGMDEQIRQRIFDPFFTTKEMGRGTGLGLASAYGIVKNHGGIINVYSERGKGSTFTVYLPAGEGEIIEEVRMEEMLVPGSETILLVDDEEMITNVGKMLLEKLGYNRTRCAKRRGDFTDIPRKAKRNRTGRVGYDYAEYERGGDVRTPQRDRSRRQGPAFQRIQSQRAGEGHPRERLQGIYSKAIRHREIFPKSTRSDRTVSERWVFGANAVRFEPKKLESIGWKGRCPSTPFADNCTYCAGRLDSVRSQRARPRPVFPAVRFPGRRGVVKEKGRLGIIPREPLLHSL